MWQVETSAPITKYSDGSVAVCVIHFCDKLRRESVFFFVFVLMITFSNCHRNTDALRVTQNILDLLFGMCHQPLLVQFILGGK